jgi:hypothetical protein
MFFRSSCSLWGATITTPQNFINNMKCSGSNGNPVFPPAAPQTPQQSCISQTLSDWVTRSDSTMGSSVFLFQDHFSQNSPSSGSLLMSALFHKLLCQKLPTHVLSNLSTWQTPAHL